jgi:hypothetical protein
VLTAHLSLPNVQDLRLVSLQEADNRMLQDLMGPPEACPDGWIYLVNNQGAFTNGTALRQRAPLVLTCFRVQLCLRPAQDA